MAIEYIQAKSWLDLHRLLFENSWQDDIKRHRSDYAFRGVSDAGFKLSTTLLRLGGQLFPDHGAKLEANILRSFKKYAYQDKTSSYSEWYWLSLAQHHGLPTRLLDWTNSPLVALHFATNDVSQDNQDGAVWCVDIHRCHGMLPNGIQDILKKERALIFSTEMLADVASTLPKFDRYDNFVLFFEPPSLDERIVNQFGFFSVMPDPKIAVDDWLEDHPDLYRKIIFPSQLKWEIRNKLDQMNITERVLFPGLDGLCNWLKRYYSPYPAGVMNTEDMELGPVGKESE